MIKKILSMIAALVILMSIGGLFGVASATYNYDYYDNYNYTAHPTVSIYNYAFNPSVVHIRPGDTVTWVNNDNSTHTVTSTGSHSFGSGSLFPGNAFSYIFTAPGTYYYNCSIHPSMTGSVIVETYNNTYSDPYYQPYQPAPRVPNYKAPDWNFYNYDTYHSYDKQYVNAAFQEYDQYVKSHGDGFYPYYQTSYPVYYTPTYVNQPVYVPYKPAYQPAYQPPYNTCYYVNSGCGTDYYPSYPGYYNW